MALGFARTLLQPTTAQTINAAATYTSAEQDIGNNTIAEQVFLFLEIDGYAAAPGGNEEVEVCIAPIHTTAGSHFDDGGAQYIWTTDADQQYQFGTQVSGLPRFFKQTVKNDTGQNTDAGAVDSWIELQKVTA